MNDTLLESKRVTVLELLDRLLETGVVVDGEIDLSVADIDLIHLGLKLVLASSATLEQNGQGTSTMVIDYPDDPPVSTDVADVAAVQPISGGSSSRTANPLQPKINFEPAKVEQGLAKLVLTLVELIRQLMEKQAIRKMAGGTLTNTQLERLGEAFRRLENKMVELKRVFGLEDDDLNLDLGPVGQLM